jgi:hypothetical protein
VDFSVEFLSSRGDKRVGSIWVSAELKSFLFVTMRLILPRIVQHLLDDSSIYILGMPLIILRDYRAFRVQLLYFRDSGFSCRSCFVATPLLQDFISLFSFNLRDREIVNKLNDATFVGLFFFAPCIPWTQYSTSCCSLLFRFVTLHICNVKYIPYAFL